MGELYPDRGNRRSGGSSDGLGTKKHLAGITRKKKKASMLEEPQERQRTYFA